MKRSFLLNCAAGVLLLAATPALIGQQQQPSKAEPRPEVAHTQLKVGDMAPDFTLASTAGGTVKLSDFRGQKNVVLAFYVLAFTGG